MNNYDIPIGYSICPTCGMRTSLVQGSKCRCQVEEELKQFEQEIKKVQLSMSEEDKEKIREALKSLGNNTK